MAFLTLQLKSNENNFRYDFTSDFYEKEYKISVTRMHGRAKKIYNFEFTKYDKKNDELTLEEFEFEITNDFGDFDDIVEQIKEQLPHGCKSAFEFNCVDNQMNIEIKQTYFEINFTSLESIGKVFEFDHVVLKAGSPDAEHEFKVPNETIFMTCNHWEFSYFNSQRRDIIYSFTVDGNGNVYTLPTPIYLKTLGKHKNLYITLVGIDNNKIEFDECDLLVNLYPTPC
jgi:hypothetical protein